MVNHLECVKILGFFSFYKKISRHGLSARVIPEKDQVDLILYKEMK